VPYYALYSSLFTLSAAFLLLSALDDLVPLLICLTRRRSGQKRGRMAAAGQRAIALGTSLERDNPERRFAIFVPCWKESQVIVDMVQHNLASIRYRHFDFYLGAYPNDEETIKAVEGLACSCRSVHVALVPHDDPTSKADCVNWVFQSLLRFEEASRRPFRCGTGA
jgi:adsorption protein B